MINTTEMFLVTIAKNELLPALTHVSKTAAKNSNILALQGVLIERVSGGIQLTCYDLKTGVTRFVPLESFDLEETSGKLLVDAKMLLEIVRKAGKEITIQQVFETQMIVQSGKNVFEVDGCERISQIAKRK